MDAGGRDEEAEGLESCFGSKIVEDWLKEGRVYQLAFSAGNRNHSQYFQQKGIEFRELGPYKIAGRAKGAGTGNGIFKFKNILCTNKEVDAIVRRACEHLDLQSLGCQRNNTSPSFLSSESARLAEPTSHSEP